MHPAIAWLRANFFSSWTSAALTLLILYAASRILPAAFDWFVTSSTSGTANLQDCVKAGGACWSFLQDKARFILFGTFPFDEQWRAASAIVLFIAVIVLSGVPSLWIGRTRRRAMFALWFAALLAIAVLLRGGVAGLVPVEALRWSGLPLTMIFAVCGVGIGFAVAIVLALGRQARLPVVRWTAIVFIEVMRGVPLISLFYMVHLLVPLILPAGVDVDKLARALIAFTLFFAAYMAEVIRGGIQAVPSGQYDAARSLGLGYWRLQRLIVLPQALRLVIPSLVNVFIAAFKDTSLVIIIAMLDLLGTANAAKADPKWWGIYIEAYLFIAAIYLVACAAMSRYSQALERRLGGARAAV